MSPYALSWHVACVALEQSTTALLLFTEDKFASEGVTSAGIMPRVVESRQFPIGTHRFPSCGPVTLWTVSRSIDVAPAPRASSKAVINASVKKVRRIETPKA